MMIMEKSSLGISVSVATISNMGDTATSCPNDRNFSAVLLAAVSGRVTISFNGYFQSTKKSAPALERISSPTSCPSDAAFEIDP